MLTYIVLYKTPDCLLLDPPLGFRCQADDTEHAEEQCMDAYPDCKILWVVITDNYEVALQDYWGGDDYWAEQG